MPIVLTTPPAHTRTASMNRYGGDMNKTDYLGIGPVNPLTDWGARDLCRTAADLAAAVRTATFLHITLTCRDTGVLNPLVHNVATQVGDILDAEYSGGAPPTGYPTITRVSDGVILVTLDSSYSDPFGTAAAFKIRFLYASAHGTPMATVQPEIVTDTTCRFHVFDAAGAALIDRKISVEIS